LQDPGPFLVVKRGDLNETPAFSPEELLNELKEMINRDQRDTSYLREELSRMNYVLSMMILNATKPGDLSLVKDSQYVEALFSRYHLIVS